MEEKIKVKIEAAVDGLRDEMIDSLAELVRIPSVVGNEGPAQDYMQRQYEGLGLDVKTFEADKSTVGQHSAYVESGLPFEGRPNVVGVLRGDPAKNSMILNGHVDVVSPEPVDQWQHDPWGAEIEGNRLYGRGAVDMKAGVIANLFALKALLNAGIEPGGDVMLQSVVEEEAGGGGGTLACLMEGYTADGMIITEPFMMPVISHPGILYFRVKIKGLTAHAGHAHLGVNAIGKMMKVYEAMVDLDLRRAATVKFPLYHKVEGRSCHLNIGTLQAGDWVSTVAGFAEMACRISFIPQESMVETKNTVERVIEEVARTDDWLKDHPPVVEWFGWHTEPWYQDPDDLFIQTVLPCLEAACNQKMEVSGVTAGLDNRFSSYFGFPSICFGPDGNNYHSFDEYVDLDSFVAATKAVALSTLDWCSGER
ncbi:Acetylornithine deacetylase (EC [Olavius sp. associated proteobacterium Delta 1]|nr:Acetylornithine deacetylase (EC [Olavius sp. associated proteobacterium Delta 1]